MTLVRFTHPALISRLANEAYSRNFEGGFLGGLNDCNQASDLRYRVSEQDTNFTLEIAVPGLSKNDLSILVEDGILTVKTVERTPEDKRTGFAALTFEKQFRLSGKVNQEGITAQTENGLLVITLAKVDEAIKKPARAVEIE